MNELQRAELYRAIAKAYMFTDRIGGQILRAQSNGSGEAFRLLTCIEAAQELKLVVCLFPEAADHPFYCDLRSSKDAPSHFSFGATNSDVVLLALADALGVEVPA